MGYSIFFLDYPGYGKSDGQINSKSELLEDIQQAYSFIHQRFDERKTVLLGYSLGSGPAAYLASKNHPRLLILQAPYYSVKDMMRKHYPIIPGFLLKYNFETFRYLKNCSMPTVIFHGDRDEVIYYASSRKLATQFKDVDTLITLKGQGHNGMSDNAEYLSNLKRILIN